MFNVRMAIADITSALAQYNSNLDWNVVPAHAQAALEAVRYLIVNQPQSYSIAGRSITKNLAELQKEADALKIFIGVAPRANGRSRVVGTRFSDPSRSFRGCRQWD